MPVSLQASDRGEIFFPERFKIISPIIFTFKTRLDLLRSIRKEKAEVPKGLRGPRWGSLLPSLGAPRQECASDPPSLGFEIKIQLNYNKSRVLGENWS